MRHGRLCKENGVVSVSGYMVTIGYSPDSLVERLDNYSFKGGTAIGGFRRQICADTALGDPAAVNPIEAFFRGDGDLDFKVDAQPICATQVKDDRIHWPTYEDDRVVVERFKVNPLP